MDDESVDQVRRFNRIVTQRIGVLDDHYLSRDRALGEARVLWEIGTRADGGIDVRALRSRLDLDSGYLSRLLRSLEADGLVEVVAKPGDRRVRTARLTTRGTAERRVLDRRSDALARSLLAPLNEAQRARLVGAMGEVERLLTAALIELAVVDPTHRDAQYCLRSYYADLDQRFALGFDPARTRPTDPEDMRPPAGLFLVARLHDAPVGCGALRFHGQELAEVKRMWVGPEARGLGVGRRLLGELEARAAANGARRVRLDTNKSLVEAISMYRSSGYVEVEPFNDEPYADHWFEKGLAAATSFRGGRSLR